MAAMSLGRTKTALDAFYRRLRQRAANLGLRRLSWLTRPLRA